MPKAKPKVRLRADRPETISQARTWERTKNRYLRYALCHKCASQAAWGHQIGFKRVHPPCDDCQPVVAIYVDGAVNGWRTVPRVLPPESRSMGAAERATAFPGTRGTPQALSPFERRSA